MALGRGMCGRQGWRVWKVRLDGGQLVEVFVDPAEGLLFCYAGNRGRRMILSR